MHCNFKSNKMETRTKQILKILNIAVWIIFIGLCIKTGSLFISFVLSLFNNPVAAENLHQGLDLSQLLKTDKLYYIFLMSLILFISALKAYLFYVIIKITTKINFVHPFSTDIAKMIMRIGYVAFEIGILIFITQNYCNLLITKGLNLSNIFEYVSGGAEFLFMAGIVFVIAQIFKRGIEIQNENELTI